ncbi:DUF2190 family protein [Paludibacteraceae bacterium OttesenSCG-928-F17]|nr:DUF2190 family protein [Paludibacteraceae bacterium OttesenSCG-928-F17]
MKNLIQDGKTIEYTVGETPVKSGDCVVVGSIAGVAVTDGAPGETITLSVTGVYELPKGPVAVKQGDKTYMGADGLLTTETTTEEGEGEEAGSTDNIFVGCAWESAEAGESVVNVKINS